MDSYIDTLHAAKLALLGPTTPNTSCPSSGGIANSAVMEGYLAKTLDQIEHSRRVFIDDVKQLIVLISALFVAGGLVVHSALSQKEVVLALVLLFAASIPLLLIFLVIRFARHKAWAAYELYVTSAVHAAVIHEALGFAPSHHWMERASRIGKGIPRQKDWQTVLARQWEGIGSTTPDGKESKTLHRNVIDLLKYVQWLVFGSSLILLLLSLVLLGSS